MNVKTFVLLNGAELIGNNVRVTETSVFAEDVVILQYQRDPKTGDPVQVFGNFPALAETGQVLEFPITGLLVKPVNVHRTLEQQFVESVTGLELPATPQILLS